jgi:hypothetical protein
MVGFFKTNKKKGLQLQSLKLRSHFLAILSEFGHGKVIANMIGRTYVFIQTISPRALSIIITKQMKVWVWVRSHHRVANVTQISKRHMFNRRWRTREPSHQTTFAHVLACPWFMLFVLCSNISSCLINNKLIKWDPTIPPPTNQRL